MTEHEGERIEWAVVRRTGFRGQVEVVRGGLGSREEAEAWQRALSLTEHRTDHERYVATDSSIVRPAMQLASRVIGAWQYEGVLSPAAR